MSGRITDDEDQENEVPKAAPNTDKNSLNKPVKPTKTASSALTLKQALQNVRRADDFRASITFRFLLAQRR